MKKLKLRTKLWKYPAGKTTWYFLTIPKAKSAKIRSAWGHKALAWGTIKVTATVGDTTWSTALFSVAKNRTYLLPMKAKIRKKQNLLPNKLVTATLEFAGAPAKNDIFAQMED